MTGEVLLDTSVAIAILNGEQAVCDKARDERVHLSATVVGELRYGAACSSRPADNLARIDKLADLAVLSVDDGTARIYAALRFAQRKKGRPVGENDLWIAATAVQHQLRLATRDADFEAIDGLVLERW